MLCIVIYYFARLQRFSLQMNLHDIISSSGMQISYVVRVNNILLDYLGMNLHDLISSSGMQISYVVRVNNILLDYLGL